jgi:dephospho-CoA kinase
MSRAAARPVRIGLTGGIGSGKSTVAQLLVGCGAHLVDTDAIARSLTLHGGLAMPALEAAFGAAAIAADGSLDRDHMRQLAFADEQARARLESILHPLIGQEALRQSAQAAGRPVVFDVPLLAESAHWRQRVDRVLVVDCQEATQVQRVSQRPGWTEAAARAVMARQASRAHRRAVADAVICNDQISFEQLSVEVRTLWALWNNPAA